MLRGATDSAIEVRAPAAPAALQVRLSLHINALEHLPPELGNLVHLEALRWAVLLLALLSGVQAALAARGWRSVGCLCLARARLPLNMPATLCNLHAPPLPGPRLRPLRSLHSNQLPELPPELGRLSECVRLSLYQNRLAALPPEIGQLTSLQVGGHLAC